MYTITKRENDIGSEKNQDLVLKSDHFFQSLGLTRGSLMQEARAHWENARVFGRKQGKIGSGHSLENLDDWSIDLLVDYIVGKHHRWAKEQAIEMLDLAQLAVYKCYNDSPKSTVLAAELFLFLHDYLKYILKKEKSLFTNIQHWTRGTGEWSTEARASINLMPEWIRQARGGHRDTVERLLHFQALTDGYSLPKQACTAYIRLFRRMKAFEDDFLLHAYLEEKFLFQRLERHAERA